MTGLIRSLVFVIAAVGVAFPSSVYALKGLGGADRALYAGHDALADQEYLSAYSYYADAYALGNPRGAIGLSVIYALGLGQPASHEKAVAYAIGADQEAGFDAAKYLTPFYERAKLKEIALVIADIYQSRPGKAAKITAFDWEAKHP